MKNWEIHIFLVLFRTMSSIGGLYYLGSVFLPGHKETSRIWVRFCIIFLFVNSICTVIFPQGIVSFLTEVLLLLGLVICFFYKMILENIFALIKIITFMGIRKIFSFYILFFVLPEFDSMVFCDTSKNIRICQMISGFIWNHGRVLANDLDRGYSRLCFLLLLMIEDMVYFTFLIVDLAVGKTLRYRMRIRILPFYLFLPLYQLLLLVLYLKTYHGVNRIMIYSGALILILNIFINFVLMFSLDKRIEKAEIEEKLTALYTQRQVEYDYCQLANKNMEDIEKVKQYYFSQFQAIRFMLKENPDNPEIRALIHASQEQVSQNPFPRFCEEEVVNAVLTLKKQMADAEQIPMDISVFIPKIIPVSALDLCSLFCNLLDNAIEACRRNQASSRYITVKADIVRGGYLLVKTENPCEQPPVRESFFFRTSKENVSEHGYGLKLIEQIAEKYQGQALVQQEQTRFIVSVLLHLAKE